LQAKLRDAEEKGKLLEQLDKSLKWQSAAAYQAIHARVIGRDAQQWFNTVIIDAGSLAGVEKDMPVVTPDGLVGRVIVVSPVSSRVMLLTDERFGAGAVIGQLTQARALGIVKGRSNSLCEMRFINSVEKVEPGEPIITSGQDGLYPRGLLIGRARVNSGAAAAPQAFEVEPAAPFNKLDLVAVLRVPKEQIRSKVAQLVNAEAEKQQQEKALGRKNVR
jgi:rod shape-determining protein MreC